VAERFLNVDRVGARGEPGRGATMPEIVTVERIGNAGGFLRRVERRAHRLDAVTGLAPSPIAFVMEHPRRTHTVVRDKLHARGVISHRGG
jgi:hypothetical protein